MVCVNFIWQAAGSQFNIDSDQQILKFLLKNGQFTKCWTNCFKRGTILLSTILLEVPIKITLHTYIHNWLLQSSIQLLTSLMLRVLILFIGGRTYSLKLTPNNWFLTNCSRQFHLLSELLPEICLLSEIWNIFLYLVFSRYMICVLNRVLTSNKPTHLLLDCSGYIKITLFCKKLTSFKNF